MEERNGSLKMELRQNWKKIVIKLCLIILILTPILSFFIISPYLFLYDSPVKQPWVSWFNDPHERVYISWETEEKTKGTVSYGPDKDDLEFEIKVNKSERIHHITLRNLTPDTRYYYEIEIDGDEFGSGKFKTAPIDYENFRFLMISDTQQTLGPGHHYRIADIIDNLGKSYAFIANVGDIVDDGGDKRHYNNFFSIASTYFDTIPFAPVIGNHDAHDVDQFVEYFINAVDDDDDQFYYSFNWSSVHFTMCHFPYGREGEMTDEQLDWLEEDLENAEDMPFRIVMFHCPIIGAAFFGRNQVLIDEVLPILEDYDVTATMHGHEHHFERGHIDDMMYLILGGGGGTFDVGLRPLPETDVLTAGPTYTEVKATDDSLQFITYSIDGTVVDDFTIEEDD